MLAKRRANALREFEESEIVGSHHLAPGLLGRVFFTDGGAERSLEVEVDALDRKTVHVSVRGVANPPVLRSGMPVRVTLAVEPAALLFDTVVQDRSRAHQAHTYVLTRPQWIERVQRRAFFRVSVELPTLITPIEGRVDEAPVYRCTVDNLSAGGFRMAAPVPLMPGTHLRVRLPVASLIATSFDAKVHQSLPAKRSGERHYYVQCEFIHLPEEIRDRLVAYCFDIQREKLSQVPEGQTRRRERRA